MHSVLVSLLAITAPSGEAHFRHHAIGGDLPLDEDRRGGDALTAPADPARDGDLDFVVGGRNPPPERLDWFEFPGADDRARHDVGMGYRSDVGLVALDVDRDGDLDIVSQPWHAQPWNGVGGAMHVDSLDNLPRPTPDDRPPNDAASTPIPERLP